MLETSVSKSPNSGQSKCINSVLPQVLLVNNNVSIFFFNVYITSMYVLNFYLYNIKFSVAEVDA